MAWTSAGGERCLNSQSLCYIEIVYLYYSVSPTCIVHSQHLPQSLTHKTHEISLLEMNYAHFEDI